MSVKKGRRDYGSGSIYQRKDGKWIGAASAGWTETGARRRVTVVAKSEAEAKRRLRRRIADLEAGAATEASRRTTIKAWADQWLPIIEHDLRPSAYSSSNIRIEGGTGIGDSIWFDLLTVTNTVDYDGEPFSGNT